MQIAAKEYAKGLLCENEATEKSLEIRQLIPSREKRISPDGNCLFRSLAYVITETDRYHQPLRELLIKRGEKNIENHARTIVAHEMICYPKGVATQ